MREQLNIFIPHCSSLLTDHRPHGDGLVAYGFIAKLAERGHSIYVAAEQVDLILPLPSNVHVYVIETKSRKGVIKRLQYCLQIRALFRWLNGIVAFDVIHQLNPVYTGISLALLGTKVPVILGPYVAEWPIDPDSFGATNRLIRAISLPLKAALAALQQRSAERVLLTTEAARSRVILSSVEEINQQILPHGVDSEFFTGKLPQYSVTLRAAAEKPVILFLANISKRKGIFDLIEAFDSVAAKVPGVQLLIAGDGEEVPAAKAASNRLAAASQVQFLGRQSRDQALQLYREATVYCLPSHGEPYGMTVAEAMSCGLPVVVTAAGGLGCLVDDFGGIKTPVGVPAALSDALVKLLDDPELRASMGLHNRQKVLATMTWDRVIDRLEEVYQTVHPKKPTTTVDGNYVAITAIED